MRHTVSERRKKWFFLRSMFRAFWEHLDKHRSRKLAQASVRPLFAEALEPRVLFSATPATVEPDPEPVDEAPVAQEAEMLVAAPQQGEVSDLTPSDPDPEGVFQQASADPGVAAASSPADATPDVLLDVPLQQGEQIGNFALSSDGANVVYSVVNSSWDTIALRSVPIGGGDSALLSSPQQGEWIGNFDLSSDGANVVYTIRDSSYQTIALRSVPIGGGDSALLSSLQQGEGVGHFVINSDGAKVVYSVVSPSKETIALRVVAMGGGDSTTLSAPLQQEEAIDQFQLSRDGASVVYTIRNSSYQTIAVYGAPTGGGMATRLSAPLQEGERIGWFEFSPRGENLAYTITNSSWQQVGVGIVAVSGGTATVSALDTGNLIQRSEFSSDGTSVVYTVRDLSSSQTIGVGIIRIGAETAAQSVPLGVGERFGGYQISPDGKSVAYSLVNSSWQTIALRGLQVGGDSPLNVPLQQGEQIANFALSSDGANVVYSVANSSWDTIALRSVPIGGGDSALLSSPQQGEWIGNFDLSSDGANVVYTIRDSSYQTIALRSVPIGGGDSALLSSLQQGEGVGHFVINSDGAKVVYSVVSSSKETIALRVVAMGGGDSTTLSAPLQQGEAIDQFHLSRDGVSVVYTIRNSSYQAIAVYGAPTGGGMATRLSAPLQEGERIGWFEFSPRGENLVYTITNSSWQQVGVGIVAVSGGTATVSALDTGNLIERWAFSSDGTSVVYTVRDFSFQTIGVEIIRIGAETAAQSVPLGVGERFGDYQISPDGKSVAYSLINSSWQTIALRGLQVGGDDLPAAPEISIFFQDTGTEIADGDVTPSGIGSEGTDFGSVSTASGHVTRTFVVKNEGTGTLTLSGQPTLTTGTHFTVSALSGGGLTLAANETRTFTVTFDPSAVGRHTDTVRLLSNDSNEASYEFQVVGIETSTDVTVDGSGNLNITDTSSGGTSDNLVLTVDGTDFRVTDSGNNVDQRVSISSVTGDIVINGGNGDDTLTIDLRGGAVTRNIVYNGGAGGFDTLVIIGTGGETLVYDPNSATFGDGVIDLGNGFTITFTSLEPVDISNVASFSLVLPGANDNVTVAEGLNGDGDAALILSGTSAGVAFEMARVRNVTTVIIDTSAVDGADTINITGAANAHGITNLEVRTGNTGTTDVVNINGAVTMTGDLLIQTRALNINALVTAANATFQPQTASTVRIGDGPTASHMVLGQTALTTNLSLSGTLTIGRADGTGLVTIQDLDTTGEGYDLSIIGGEQVSQTLGVTGNLITDGDLSISANQIVTGVQDFEMAAGTSIRTSGAFTLSVGSNAGSSVMNLRQIEAGGALAITSAGTNSIVLHGTVSSTGSTVSVQSGRLLTVNGSVSGTGAVTLSAGSNLAINQMVQSSGGDVTASAAGDVTVTASVTALGGANISITANSDGANVGDLLSITSVASLVTAGGDIVLTSGTGQPGSVRSDVQVGGSFSTAGGDLRISSDDDITVFATELILGTGALHASAPHSIFIEGLITVTSAADLNFTADTGAAAGNGRFSMTGAGAISGNAELVNILAENTSAATTLRSITAGEIRVTGTGSGDMTLVAGQTLVANATDVTLASAGSLTLTGDAVNGAILAEDKVSISAAGAISIVQKVEAVNGSVDIESTGSTVTTTVTTGDLVAGTTVAITSTGNTTLNGDVTSFDGVTVNASGTASVNGGITVIDPAALITISGTVAVTLGDAANFSSAGGDITLTAGTGAGTTADATIRGAFTTAGGNLSVNADDNIDFDSNGTTLTLGAGDAEFSAKGSITLDHTINVVSGDALVFNVNTGLNAGDDFDMTGVDSRITGNAASITILAHSATAAHTLRDIQTGAGGTVTVTTTGNGSTELAAGSTIDADGLVSFNTIGDLTISGVLDSGSGRIDIHANSDGSGDHTFTMGAEGALRNTNSSVVPATPAVSILVSNTATAASIREITTNGLVRIDMNGTAGITQTNTTLGGAGITANGAGDVIIDSEGALTINGSINAGSGLISLSADTVGDTETHDLTIGSLAILATSSSSASAIVLAAGTTGLLADVNLEGLLITGNGGGISVTAADNVVLGSSSLNVGATGTITVSAKDAVNVSGTVTIEAAALLTIDVNTDAGGTANSALVMAVGAEIIPGTTGAALIDINIHSTGGTSTIRTIASAAGGTIDIDANGSGTLNFATGTVGRAAGGNLTILVNAEGTIDINNVINAGSGTVAITANSSGADTQGLTGSATGSITTTNAGATAIVIDVNGGGGTGGAELVNLTAGAGGTIRVTNHNGLVSTLASTTTSASNGTILLKGTDLAVNATSTINAGSGSILLQRSTSGAMGINVGVASVFRVNDAEIDRMIAGTLTFGDANAATNLVTAIDVAGSVNTTAEVSGQVILNTPGNVSFATGTAAVFNALTVNADQDANGTGNFITAGTASISTAAANGNIILNAADFVISATSSTSSGSGDISLLPTGSGRTVELGGSSLGLNVTLSDAELDTLSSTGTLRIGNSATGAVTFSDGVTRPGGTGHTVITTGASVLDASSATNDYTGSSLRVVADLQSGATPLTGVFNVTGAFTLDADNTFTVDIIGNATPVAGTHYDQIKVTAAAPGDIVTIGANVLLEIVQSGPLPGGRAEYMIIDNGTANPVSGRFLNALNNDLLDEGDVFELADIFYQISYEGGDGNDVVITALGPVETSATLDGDGNLVISDVEDLSTNDTLTLSVVGSNLRIRDANFVVGADGIPSAVRIDPFTIEIPLAAFNGIIVNTGGGDDVITIGALGDTATFANFLLVDGAAGFDTINFNSNLTVTGILSGTDQAISLAADTINVDTGSTVESAVSGGTVTLTADRNILVRDSALLGTVDADLALVANLAGTATGNFAGIQIGDATNGGAFLGITGSGDLSLSGRGGDTGVSNIGVLITGSTGNFTRLNVEDGGLSISGTGGSGTGRAEGVSIHRTNITREGAGVVLIQGTGGSGGNVNYGVQINFNSTITSDGGDGIEIRGAAGNGGGNDIGVATNRSVVLSTDAGPILILGTGGGSGSGNSGVELINTTVTAADGLTISGTGSTSGTGNSNIGTSIRSTGLTSNSGDLSITGVGGTGTNANSGIDFAFATVQRNGSGTLIITGTGNGTTQSNYGILINQGTTLRSDGGSGMIVFGRGGEGTTSNTGIFTDRSPVLSTNAGDISLTGVGGGSGGQNRGVHLKDATVNSAGSLVITGTGSQTPSSSATLNQGVLISGTSVTSTGGLTITGYGGLGAGSHRGVEVIGSSSLTGGSIVVMGTASSGTTGTSNVGVWMNLIALNSSGSFNILGTGGGGTGTNHGIYMQSITNSGTAPTSTGTAGGGATSLATSGNFFP